MKKRWRIIAIVLLSLIAFTWWKLSTPPAFADFVYKAGGEVEFLGKSRIGEYVQVSSSGTRTNVLRIPNPAPKWKYQTTASLQSVIIALGDQIGDENVSLKLFGALARKERVTFVIHAKSDGGVNTALIEIQQPFTPSELDKLLNKVWPGWIELRAGRIQSASPSSPVGMIRLEMKDLEAIKKLRPKMKIRD